MIHKDIIWYVTLKLNVYCFLKKYKSFLWNLTNNFNGVLKHSLLDNYIYIITPIFKEN